MVDEAPSVGWQVTLDNLERLEREEGDEGEIYFAVEFRLDGMGCSGSLSVIVDDPVDECTVVAEAREQLQAALGTYARVVARRRIAGPDAGDAVAAGPSLPARVEAVELLLREGLAVVPGRAVAVDRARQTAGALVSEAVLSGDEQRQEHAAAVRAAVERLTT